MENFTEIRNILLNCYYLIVNYFIENLNSIFDQNLQKIDSADTSNAGFNTSLSATN